MSSLKTVLKTIAHVLNASQYNRAALKEPVLQRNSNVLSISQVVYTLKNMNGFLLSNEDFGKKYTRKFCFVSKKLFTYRTCTVVVLVQTRGLSFSR